MLCLREKTDSGYCTLKVKRKWDTQTKTKKCFQPSNKEISIEGNSTLVDSFGNYRSFNETQFNKINKQKSKKKSKVTRNNNREVREIYKLREDNDFKQYYTELYDKLTNEVAHCVPLVSSDPTYNPYHQDLIIGNISDKPNIIYTRNSPLFDDPNVEIEGKKNNFCSNVPT